MQQFVFERFPTFLYPFFSLFACLKKIESLHTLWAFNEVLGGLRTLLIVHIVHTLAGFCSQCNLRVSYFKPRFLRHDRGLAQPQKQNFVFLPIAIYSLLFWLLDQNYLCEFCYCCDHTSFLCLFYLTSTGSPRLVRFHFVRSRIQCNLELY